ncbi:beta-ketoacyl synthase chain length factor [Nostoc ellipsosporum NOK]|nr:beta-ketoacyl synthase chain length factor [Nostoc ellipsosporum NOK]
MYIRSAAAVSPQASFEALFTGAAGYQGEHLACIEPDYTTYIDPKLIRRMSRIIKMGTAAAIESLKAAGLEQPGAIVTGTAYGCLADTDAFLSRLVEFKEELLSPTAFIQSTHNTVAGQIALLLKCHRHNNTFVHKGFSFESALLDARTMIGENEISTALVGGTDEITTASHALLRRFGLYRSNGDSLHLVDQPGKGTMAGEGAAFFVLDAQQSPACLAKLDALQTWYKPADMNVIKNGLQALLTEQGLQWKDIDLLVTGRNGDTGDDKLYDAVATETPAITFKQYCGEYPTATAFGLWMASHILHEQRVPGKDNLKPRRILLYNHYQQTHHAAYLLSAC